MRITHRKSSVSGERIHLIVIDHLKNSIEEIRSFDFAIQPHGDRPEGVIQAINRLTKDRAASLAFMVSDVERERGKGNLAAFAFINDSEEPINSEHLSALTAYGIKPIPWSKREADVTVLTV